MSSYEVGCILIAYAEVLYACPRDSVACSLNLRRESEVQHLIDIFSK